MKRRFVVEIEEASPLAVQLHNATLVEEVTLPRDIAHHAAFLVSDITGKVILELCETGDNGADDIGYDLIDEDGVRCTIGVTKVDGIWRVCINRGMTDYPIDSYDDLKTLLT